MATRERLLGKDSSPLPPSERPYPSSAAINKCLDEILKDSPEFRMYEETQEQEQQILGSKTNGEGVNVRETWTSPLQFFLYCLGYAVSFGNVWRFPYLCYKNGGAAFLIPYMIMLLVAGIPIFCLELTLGQYISLSPATLFPKLAPILSGLGVGMVIISFLTAIYFSILMAWIFFYIFATFAAVLPWSSCNNDFNTPACYMEEGGAMCRNKSLYYYDHTCLNASQYCQLGHLSALNDTHCYNPDYPSQIKPVEGTVLRVMASEEFFRNRMLKVTGRTWDDMGEMQWELVGFLLFAWIIVGACLVKGIKLTGKIVYFTALFPYLVLVILFARGITLDGAYQGLEFYLLRPNITRLTEVEVWSDAAIQIYYSLGICFGCHITLSSYNKFSNNCVRDTFAIAISNCLTSVFIGLVIFSILGFMAKELGLEVGEVATSGSGLVFIVFPAAISLMPFPQIWSILFFIMLLTIGLGSQFTMVETVLTALVDQVESLRVYKAQVVTFTCLSLFVMGLTMCLEGGIYMFELFFFFSAGFSIVILGLMQLIGVQSVFGYRNMMLAMKEMGIDQPRVVTWYWAVTWLFLTPVSLIMIAFCYLHFFMPAYWGDYEFPYEIQVLGWLLCGSSMISIPIGAIIAIVKNKGSMKNLFVPSPEFCPASVRPLLKAKGTEIEPRFRYTMYHNDAFMDAEMTTKEKSHPPEK